MLGLDRASESLARRGRELWALAVLAFGVGDLATTGLGVAADQIVEAGPLGVPVVREYGMYGMVALKATVFGLSYGAWRLVPDPQRVGIPLGLATVGVLVTVWNAVVLVVTWW